MELAIGAGGARLLVTYLVADSVTVHASWRPCQASGAAPALAGGVGYLLSSSQRHLDVEGQVVQARWRDMGEWQSLTMNAAPPLRT